MYKTWQKRGAVVAALTLSSLTFLACGSPVRVQTTSADASRIGDHPTYARETASAPDGYRPGARTANVLKSAWDEVDANLAKRGFVLADEKEARLTVRLASGVKIVESRTSGGALRDGAPATDPDTLSTLVVQILDRKSGDILFQGTAEREIHSDKVDAKEIGVAVTKMLAPLSSAPR